MKCARCGHTMTKREVEGGRYVRSFFTKRHYCIRPSCKTRDPAMRDRDWVADAGTGKRRR